MSSSSKRQKKTTDKNNNGEPQRTIEMVRSRQSRAAGNSKSKDSLTTYVLEGQNSKERTRAPQRERVKSIPLRDEENDSRLKTIEKRLRDKLQRKTRDEFLSTKKW